MLINFTKDEGVLTKIYKMQIFDIKISITYTLILVLY